MALMPARCIWPSGMLAGIVPKPQRLGSKLSALYPEQTVATAEVTVGTPLRLTATFGPKPDQVQRT